jgi:V-type H+-transporting ATPase subunit F
LLFSASCLPLPVQIAADIRYLLNAYDKVIPTVLEIPSKDKPYHEEQDPIMQRVLKLMGSRD